MRSFSALLPAAFLLFAATLLPLASFAQTYECNIKAPQARGWIPSWILFKINADENTVTVVDPITYDSTGRPQKLPLRVNTQKRAEFKWKTGRLKSTRNHEVHFSYSATFLKKKSLMVIYAKPLGYHNDFRGRGPCALSKRKVK